MAVYGRYYITHLFYLFYFFLEREITTYNKWFSPSNKRWLSERFSFLSRYELLYLNTFYSVLMFYIFIQLPIFILILIIIVMIIFVIIVFVIVIVIISSFSMLLTYFSSFYRSILSLYISNILNFKQMTWPKHCSKLALKILRLYQCLWWELWTLFA